VHATLYLNPARGTNPSKKKPASTPQHQPLQTKNRVENILRIHASTYRLDSPTTSPHRKRVYHKNKKDSPPQLRNPHTTNPKLFSGLSQPTEKMTTSAGKEAPQVGRRDEERCAD
jgi:hypothetical protein